MASMQTGYDLTQEQRPWVSPSLIEANYILSLSRLELQDVIAAEMDANPALDVEERTTCPQCGSVLDGTFCTVCLISQHRDGPSERFEDFPEQLITGPALRDADDEFDPLIRVAAEESLPDQILTDARTILEPHEYPIAEYLVDAIDERGFLVCDLAELARLVAQPIDAIESVLEVIQDVAPVGVAARDLRECLLLQLNYLAHAGEAAPPHVHAIIDGFLAEFGAHKFGHIAKELGLTTEEVEEARDFIRTHLNPFPLQTKNARSWQSPSRAAYVAPDVTISHKDGELHVEIVETPHFHLRLSPLYERLATDLGRRRASVERPSPNGANGSSAGGHTNGATIASTAITSDEDRTHVRQYTNRARMFMSNIQQRRETLLKISRCICELQENFLRDGVRELRPLTRAVVAQQVGVHESTVSRATADKYVMLPSRKVIPFSDFFTPSLSVKDVIKELIEREVKNGQILTDRRICDLLLQDGIRIARRTVAKYRAELGILPSTMR